MVDLTVAAVPFYFASMGAEHWWQQRHRGDGPPSPGDYERNDTLVSLGMGVGSLLVPLATRPLMRRFDVGDRRWGRAALGVAGAAAVAAVRGRCRRPESDGLEAGRLPDPTTGQARSDRPMTGPIPRTSRGERRARLAPTVARRVGGFIGAGRDRRRRCGHRRNMGESHHGAPDLATSGAARLGDRARSGDHRRVRLGRHLLLEPPDPARGALPVGDPRRAPLQ